VTATFLGAAAIFSFRLGYSTKYVLCTKHNHAISKAHCTETVYDPVSPFPYLSYHITQLKASFPHLLSRHTNYRMSPHSLSLYTALDIVSPILLTQCTFICNGSYLSTRTQIRDNVPTFEHVKIIKFSPATPCRRSGQ